ncbi:MAG: hypothetical protein M0Z94_18595 [Dehalococcoidales bacterium]|nr:hypothetical protein [Dehalococcoidales bacterium]
MKEVAVHLAKTLWSHDRTDWDKWAPGIWDRMKRAYEGREEDLLIHTSPREEAGFGEVHIEQGLATAYFALGRETEHYRRHLPAVDGEIDETRGFQHLMEDISRVELALDKQAPTSFKEQPPR